MRTIFLSLILCLSSSALASGVDDAFALQDKPINQSVTVDKSVYEKNDRSRSDVADRFMTKERERQQLSTQAPEGQSSQYSTETLRSTPQSAKWRCEFLCGKSAHTVWVDAADKSSAQDLAMQFGKQNCWSLSKSLFEPMLGRVAACTKQ
jgi:hypothetical protein